MNTIEPGIFQMQGWVCPKCGNVMSPFQSYCIFCHRTGTGGEATSGISAPPINQPDSSADPHPNRDFYTTSQKGGVTIVD